MVISNSLKRKKWESFNKETVDYRTLFFMLVISVKGTNTFFHFLNVVKCREFV